MRSRARFGIAVAVLSTVLLTVSEIGHGQEGKRPAVSSNEETGPSFDDIKDVCEAIQFVAITAGIAAALYWFKSFWLPRAQSARVEFNVDVRRVDGCDGSQLIEVSATISNVGCVPARIARCRFALSSVNTDAAATNVGPLAASSALTPLFETEWAQQNTMINAETRAQFTCPAAIPANVTHVVVTGHLMLRDSAGKQSASKLVAMIGKPAD